jgi:acyl carrier protein phosphodiesterase
MNFLAHLYLSGSDPDVMTGNFIGDFIKGRSWGGIYPPKVVQGIELHRSIDAFTDSHPVVSRSKKRLFPIYRHYAGVIVDIYYDHFLARNWNEYHADLLPDYAGHCYEILQTRPYPLPDQVHMLLPHMMRTNWLVNYGTMEGIHRALSGMARRTTFASKMEESINDLERDYQFFKQEFDEFFPALKQHAEEVGRHH